MLIAALVGAASFLWVVGAGPLDGAHPMWRNPAGDLAQMVAGAEALFREPWGFPPTVSTLLVRPIPVSIVFTDSVPWLVLALKALGLPPSAVNPLTLFLLLSHVLQAVAAVALLRAAGVRRDAVLLGGAILALLLPAWIYRQAGHPALAGHWIILFALALAVAAARRGLSPAVAAGFAALGALAVGVHAYHVLPVAACCASALASELLQRRARAAPRAAMAGLAFAAAVGAAAAVLGYGSGAGESNGGSVLGLLSMNLLGPVLPQGSTLFGQRWTGAIFTGTVDPTGLQYFEGYNYLGAGVLLLLAAAAIAAAALLPSRRPSSGCRSVPALVGRYGPLGAALLALTLLAIGPRVYAGERLVLDLPRPDGALGDALGYVRAHGRLFWTVAYSLLAASLAVLDRTMPARAVLALCAGAILLQAYDTRGVREAVAGLYGGPGPAVFPEALQETPAGADRHWRFLPTLHCAGDADDREAIRQWSLLAIRRGGTSNSAPTARNPIADCAEPLRRALDGAADPADALVLLRRSFTAEGVLAAIATRNSPCHAFDRGLICGNGFEGVPGLSRVETSSVVARLADWRESLPLAGPAARLDLFSLGWSINEPTHRWTEGKEAALVFSPPPAPGGAGMILQLEAAAHPGRRPGGGQRVAASVNGGPAQEWLVGADDFRLYELPLPATSGDATLTVRLATPDAVSPAEMGRGPDHRRLGIAVRRMGFRAPDAP